MKVDFRQAKQVAKSIADSLNANDKWKWEVNVKENEIKVRWEYLQYIGKEDDHFTIKMGDKEECEDTDDFVVAKNHNDEFMTGRIIGTDKSWKDGDLKACVSSLLISIATIAHSRY